jgi:hypothetical protein
MGQGFTPLASNRDHSETIVAQLPNHAAALSTEALLRCFTRSTGATATPGAFYVAHLYTLTALEAESSALLLDAAMNDAKTALAYLTLAAEALDERFKEKGAA